MSAARRAGSALFVAMLVVAIPGAGYSPGKRTADLPVLDSTGNSTTLHRLAGRRGLVLITADAECPVSQRYASRIDQLAQHYASAGFTFVVLDLTPRSLVESLAEAPARRKGTTIRDDAGSLAAALG